ncbi:lipopolysaccharide biosynthesis protein [Paenibacillus swuensis]|uniref:Lipopolysaccharide biosynthesis protein n=1 Tax=Paenibacillus swuensis TaxID=1178515 RepID=A0A172TH65_9BACL|nr:Wzz/FepE/Etk N-terminal domain-containing protein [Paenibacillus swuensis]ANE46399.1 lipopolysaccharide biosynthesis protein [Paenibacillus swuensis]
METSELKDYVNTLKRRLWLIVAIVLITTIAAGLYSYMMIKPTYEASTKLIVNLREDSSMLGQTKLEERINSNMKLVDTYKEIIKTPAILDKVTAKYPQLETSVAQLNKKISVSSVNATQIMTVKVRDTSYEKAADTANAISVVFKEQIPSIMKIDNVMILNYATTEGVPVPVAPNKILNIIVAFVLSLILSVGLAFALELLDDTFKTERDVERFLGLNTLAVVHTMTKSDMAPKSTKHYKRVGEAGYATINQ